MSESILQNYGRSLAKMALHFNCDPTSLSLEQVEDYLLYLKEKHTPSQSYFKHTIYGLRFAFRLQGKAALALKLPLCHSLVRDGLRFGKHKRTTRS